MFDLLDVVNDISINENARSSLGYILEDFSDIKKRYISLGFHLNEFKNCQYYKEFGFFSFEDFCNDLLPLDKGAISRCINVWKEFCYKDNSGGFISRKMWIDDKYKEFSYSQLSEMLPLNSKRRKMVKPDMTVKQIRELKKKVLLDPKILKYFIEQIIMHDFNSFTDTDLLNEMERHGKSNSGGVRESISYDFKPGKVRFGFNDDYYYSFKQIIDAYAALPDNKMTLSCDVATCETSRETFSFSDLETDIFLTEFFNRITIFLKNHMVDKIDVKRSGKKLSFLDPDGNSYSICFSVTKNKN